MKKKLFLAFAALLFAVSMNATSVSLSFDNRVGHFNDFENSLKVSSDVEGCDVRPAVVWIYKEGTLVYVYTLKGNDNVYFTLSDFFAKMDEVNDKFEGFEDGVEYSVKFSYSRMGNVYVNAAKQGQECDVEFLYNGEKHTIKDFDVSSYNTTDITINTIWELWKEIDLKVMSFSGMNVTTNKTVKAILGEIELPEEAATANKLELQNMSIQDINGVELKEDDMLAMGDTIYLTFRYKGAEKTYYDKLKADMRGSAMSVSMEDGLVVLRFKTDVAKFGLRPLYFTGLNENCEGITVKDVTDAIVVPTEDLSMDSMKIRTSFWLSSTDEDLADDYVFVKNEKVTFTYMCSYSPNVNYKELETKIDGKEMINGKVNATNWYIQYTFVVGEAATSISSFSAKSLPVAYAENGKIDCDGDRTQITDVNGVDVTALNGSLRSGIYVVECDGVRTKVIMR